MKKINLSLSILSIGMAAITSIVIVACSSGSNNGGTANSPKVIFVTESLFNGNLHGYVGADALCNIDAARPAESVGHITVYKALLAGRDDVLKSGQTYIDINGKVIGVANPSEFGWFDSKNTNFIAPNSSPKLHVWTGGAGTTYLPGSIPSEMTCNGWTESSVSGIAGYNSESAIFISGALSMPGFTGVGGLQGSEAAWETVCPLSTGSCNPAGGAFATYDNIVLPDNVDYNYWHTSPCSAEYALYCVAQ